MTFDDPRDPLGRKVLRAEVHDGLLLVDLPKRYAGDRDAFSEPTAERALDREGCRYLLAFLTEALPRLRGG